MAERTFTLLTPFGGFGLGARGFQDAGFRMDALGIDVRWELLGGIDIDPLACQAFEYLTGVPQLCADMRALTPADLRKHFGQRAPDCVFTSAPCVGASGLLSAKKAATAKYQEMNDLSLVWARLMVAAWADEPPAMLLFENVPRLTARAPKMIAELRRILKRAGYVFSDSYHDCGEIGGLAQRRRRWLLVARQPSRCSEVLRQPPKKRVRACGEVLEQLPMPGTPAARAWGRMHELPRLSWLNWVRLSMIPKGGDWRDLEGVLAKEQERREVFKRHAVEDWAEPVGTIGGSGSNGVANVADPRVACAPRSGAYGVQDWMAPSKTVTGALQIDNGPAAVADPRLNLGPNTHNNLYQVRGWEQPVSVVTGAGRPGQGAPSVTDPRVQVKRAFDAGYAVLDWRAAARTIAGISSVGCGAYAVADPRIDEAPPDGGVWTGDPRKAPPFIPVILAEDNTWHRPLTTLELAALQGFPLTVNGKPLALPGSSHVAWRRGVGNAVPAPAARAIGEKMLLALVEGATGSFSLSPDLVWVSPDAEASHG